MRLRAIAVQLVNLFAHELGRFPGGAGQRHLQTESVELDRLGVPSLSVLVVAALPQLADVCAPLGIDGHRRRRDDVRGVETVQGAVEGVEGCELRFERSGGWAGG